MTPEEQTLLVRVANADRTNVLSLIFELLCYGIHLPLFIHAMLIIHPRIRSSLPARWLYALIIILFSFETLRLVMAIDLNIIHMSWPKLGSPEDTLRVKLTLANIAKSRQDAVCTLVSQLVIALADAIVVWRAYVLWAHNVRVRVTLLAGLVINVAFGVVNAALGIIWALSIQVPDRFTIATNAVGAARDITSFSVNVLATVCIGIRFRNFRAMYQKDGRALARSRVARTMSLMVEAGALLAIIQIVSAVISICAIYRPYSADPVFVAAHTFEGLLVSVAALYPCIVTILLSRKSLTDLENPLSTEKSFNASPPTDSEKQTAAEGRRNPQLSTIRFVSHDSAKGADSDAAASSVDGDMEAGRLAR